MHVIGLGRHASPLSSTVQSTIKHGNMDLGPLSQLTKATNVFLDLQQRLCQGWPSASSSSISAAAKLTSLSTFTSGSELSGGVVVTFSLKFGGYQALHLHSQIHDSWGPRRVHHHQCLEEDAWYQRNGERGEDGRSAAWSINTISICLGVN